jgi:hypothetical protein
MDYQDRIVFLVGAGLVQDAGLPISTTLAQKLRETLIAAATSDLVRPGERAHAETLLSVLRLLIGGIRFQEGVLNRDPDRPVNIEQVAVAAIQLSRRYENPIASYASGWHERLSALETRAPDVLQHFVDFIYSQLNEWLTLSDVKRAAYLARLVDFVKEANGIDIFTLNYDTCVERTLNEVAKQQFVNGFLEDGWHPELFASPPSICLYKLHGSLDWVDDEAYGLCASQFPRHKHAEDIDPSHPPLLIFGTNQKLSARQPFLTLAYYFSEAVRSTATLVIIGYSFGDEYINAIIEQGLRTNARLRIVVVAPDASVQTGSSALLSNNPRVLALDSTALEAFNTGALLMRVRALIAEARESEPF